MFFVWALVAYGYVLSSVNIPAEGVKAQTMFTSMSGSYDMVLQVSLPRTVPSYSANSLVHSSGKHLTLKVNLFPYQIRNLTITFTMSSAPQLVSMGTLLNPDPMRIIAKRITLSGHPTKVHKKTATVRYMFFNSGKLWPTIAIRSQLPFYSLPSRRHPVLQTNSAAH